MYMSGVQKYIWGSTFYSDICIIKLNIIYLFYKNNCYITGQKYIFL